MGAISRYLIQAIQIVGYHNGIPLNTLLINLTGSFLIAFLFTVAMEVRELDSDIRLGITTGYLGGFTTFSTLCKETVALMQSGNYFTALSYSILSILIGLGLAYFGVIIARGIGVKVKKTHNKMDQDEG